MIDNLLRETWVNLDSFELRLLLDARFGGPGQYADDGGGDKIYLPSAGSSCRIALTFADESIVSLEPGQAFDTAEWARVSDEIERSILDGQTKIGRYCSFSSFRVTGSWRGDRSGVQILPPPDGAPRARIEIADHPFILEFPIMVGDVWAVTNYRRMREHRHLTLLLNILLAGNTSLPLGQSKHVWAMVPSDDKPLGEAKWVHQWFFMDIGDIVRDELTKPDGKHLEEVEPAKYYESVGHDGNPLRVPTNLDDSIFRYKQLPPANRTKFDRATYWMAMAWSQRAISASSSFASLVSAVESLTDRGTAHSLHCEKCNAERSHEVPGATENFRAFFEQYAHGATAKSRNRMYELRSRILHGERLMQLDQNLAFGWDPPWWKERELYDELWSLTRVALRHWLKNPPKDG